jgi:hypothetical protein
MMIRWYGDYALSCEVGAVAVAEVERPRERVPTKMPIVTASTAKWPRKAPEQPATAMGAIAARYQGVSFIRVLPGVEEAGLSCETHM